MLQIENIHRTFEDTPVLRGVSLEVGRGEIMCLLGPSGCGKTTLLRIVAGLETADSGSLSLEGENLMPIPPHQRGFGLMFQDFALFPHLNVAQNVAFGLRTWEREQRESRVAAMLELVGLAEFRARAVTELSGGEQQRVALARSLAPHPLLLMLDEPLGSLDAALRERLAVELRDILKAEGTTALYVTHDQSEALTIADRVAIMNAGQFEQIAPPMALYRQPKTAFAARFLGLTNIFSPTELARLGIDSQSTSLLHPAYLRLGENGLTGRVISRTFHGPFYRLGLEVAGLSISLILPTHTATIPTVGDTVGLMIPSEALISLL